MLGSVRIGPDLANVGTRHSRATLLRILLDPQLIREGARCRNTSSCLRKSMRKRTRSLFCNEKNIYYKPTKDADALVDYLLSLKGAQLSAGGGARVSTIYLITAKAGGSG